MQDIYLDIARFSITVSIPDDLAGFTLSSAFSPFIVDAPVPGHPLIFRLTLRCGKAIATLPAHGAIATGLNDLGEMHLYHNGSNYSVALSPAPGLGYRVMEMDPDFTSATATIEPADIHSPYGIVESMLRIIFSQAVVAHDAFLLHASAVIDDSGRAFLFMGRSGTGKSTHSRLWMSTFPGVTLLNDDNPVIRLMPDATAIACGSPWSGKTPCYRNEWAPLQALVRLSQAPCDRFTPLSDLEAFLAILPGVSVISHDTVLYSTVCDTVIKTASAVRVGSLECLPHAAAAVTCRNSCHI